VNRTVREITDMGEIESILNEASVCRIGLADGGEPYIVRSALDIQLEESTSIQHYPEKKL